MNLKAKLMSSLGLVAMAASAIAMPLAKGTPVELKFERALSSRHAYVGEVVPMRVADNVYDHGRVVIRQGPPVTAIIRQVEKNGRFGKNGVLKLDIMPIHADGATIPLQPRQKGRIVGGTRGTETAGAAGAGLLVLGPLGLGAGYFVVGKSVNVMPGDHLETQVAHTVSVR